MCEIIDLRGVSPDNVMECWGWISVPIACGCGDPDCLGEAHEIVPKWDLRKHLCGDGAPPCWCEPEADCDRRIIVHNTLDGREKFETGERKLS